MTKFGKKNLISDRQQENSQVLHVMVEWDLLNEGFKVHIIKLLFYL